MSVMDSRETIRCSNCDLNQFKTASGNCRKCSEPYISAAPIPAAEAEPISISDLYPLHGRQTDSGRAVKILRTVLNLSQRRLAERMGVPRTYVSKLEQHHADPTLSSIARLSVAFGISERDFVALASIGNE
jgi:ribosome-binding protein aMBF1 (putative translation factor)